MTNRILALTIIAIALPACERAEPTVIGQWTAADPEAEWTVDIREDSTWTMRVGTLDGDGTFTTAEDDEETVVLHTTGTMAEVMPRGFRAHLSADTLRLCSAAGCTDMVRTGEH
jgi:hypothetical protein